MTYFIEKKPHLAVHYVLTIAGEHMIPHDDIEVTPVCRFQQDVKKFV